LVTVMRSEKYLPTFVEIHGRKTRLQWVMDHVLNWFGPFETLVPTGLPCCQVGCNGMLLHAYETVEIRGKGHKCVFTQTKTGRRVVTKCRDTCTLPSCPGWGEWTLVAIEDDTKLARAYRKKTRTWRFRQ